MLVNGSMAIDGLPESAAAGSLVGFAVFSISARTRNIRIGRAMFLTVYSPRSSNDAAKFPATWSWTVPEI